ncbi:hypothetical protein F5B19DRAFT_452704 [Rostrohypoxylon terebratum]|nr:hypothetical protein F5B19DRAFT_452704 [Rostrohypoxylon terebratum]
MNEHDRWEDITDGSWQRAYIIINGIPCMGNVIMAASRRILYTLLQIPKHLKSENPQIGMSSTNHG